MPEPLIPLSRFAFDWANTLCEAEHGCASYHRMWPFLRLIETGGALPAGEAFIRREVKACSRDGKIHALISGGADTGVMALAVEAALKDCLNIRITAIDRCHTPLEQMRLYGAANSIEVETHAITLDQIPDGLDANIILGHSILSQIPTREHQAVWQAWAAALCPGGRIVMSQRLSPPGAPPRQRWTSELVETRHQALNEKLKALDASYLAAPKEIILEEAKRFWTLTNNAYHVVKEDIYSHAQANNLRVVQMKPISDVTTVSPFSFTKLAIQRLRYEIVLEKPAA